MPMVSTYSFQNGALQRVAVNVSGRVTPTDYGNFDERYQTKTGGVQNFQYTSEVFYNQEGTSSAGRSRAPPRLHSVRYCGSGNRQ